MRRLQVLAKKKAKHLFQLEFLFLAELQYRGCLRGENAMPLYARIYLNCATCKHWQGEVAAVGGNVSVAPEDKYLCDNKLSINRGLLTCTTDHCEAHSALRAGLERAKESFQRELSAVESGKSLEEAARRLQARGVLERLITPQLVLGEQEIFARGFPLNPRQATGKLALGWEEARKSRQGGQDVILALEEPDTQSLIEASVLAVGILLKERVDFPFLYLASGVIYSGDFQIDRTGRSLAFREHEVFEGESLSIDGDSGKVYRGEMPLVYPEDKVLSWFLGKLGLEYLSKTEFLEYLVLFNQKQKPIALDYYDPDSQFCLGSYFFARGLYKYAIKLFISCLGTELPIERRMALLEVLAQAIWLRSPGSEAACSALFPMEEEYMLAQKIHLSAPKLWYQYLVLLFESGKEAAALLRARTKLGSTASGAMREQAARFLQYAKEKRPHQGESLW